MIFFIHRVISYIKNGWEDTFLDKWQHLSDKQTVNKESVNTRTVTNTIDFPSSAEWTPLINDKNDVPAFNMQNIVCYFIDRKTKDEEANKDDHITYDDHISLELAYPRVANGLPRLSKLISRNY